MSENNRHRRVASQMAERYGVDPEVFTRLIARESSWDPNAKGANGELGYTQIMLETGIDPGYGVKPISDRNDPIDNLRFGAEYLGALIEYYDGDYSKALMAYNGGAGNVNKGTVSDAAQKYAAAVMSGKEVQTKPKPRPSESKPQIKPAPRPTGLVPQAEDKKGMDAISKGIEDLLAPKQKLRLEPPPRIQRFGRSGRMSPLSGTGIPGLGNIKRYSTPGGIESLYRATKS
jgi:hypothetical protein